ncbi:hypothetical protein PRZ48_000103 [Zasmidium cellare]|uniref:Uncharacterized protein n=1 Tax=Zasmidium cellare TaxID=395010 RepID=A0ABR0EYT7_ZASCE|nr:hypothetical protein PRZ48_000103 [Zasmidium cellare]
MSRLGWADLGLATADDMVQNAGMIASLSPSTPVIADADTGYAGPVNVARTVARYAHAGVAGLHIEDQAAEKRCGHLAGKVLVEQHVWLAKLKAAVQTRKEIGSEIVIIARTDARQSYGFDEAIERLQKAVEIGVDAVFFEAPQSKEEVQRVAETFRKTNTPCLLNMVPGGATPWFKPQEAQELGFSLMLYPGLCIGPVIHAVREEMAKLRDTGNVSEDADGKVKEGFNLTGLQELIEIDQHAGGAAYGTVGS